ncbi:MAG: complex I NDUFA9 subunit family protein [Rhodomicrobium sp.]|jgi:NADH dehydrogenase
MTQTFGNSTVVTVFGGSGFVGRYVAQALARAGCRIKVAVRRPELALSVLPLGSVGQIALVQANVRDEKSVADAVRGADFVVNLVGILQPSGRQRFGDIHGKAPETIAKAAKAAGARGFVQVSAIGADRVARSAYARTKGEGEARALAAFPQTVVLRPSLVFGPEDQFFNRFAGLAAFSPVLPLIGGRTRFQPVYVGDAARAVAAAVSERATEGAVYELGGPTVYTFREILEKVCEWTQRSPALLPIPFWMAKIPAFFVQFLPGAPITLDQLRLLQRDNVVSAEAIREGRTLEGLGVTEPRSAEAIVPPYLQRYRPHGEFSTDRLRAL